MTDTSNADDGIQEAAESNSGVLIECTIRRQQGSKTVFNDRDGRPEYEYHFKPDGKHGEAHVCLVSNPEHIEIFLGIKEAYKVYDGKPPPQNSIRAAPPVRAPDDIDNWNNERLMQYADRRQILWRNKSKINDYCLEHFDCGLNNQAQAIEMVRQLARIERAHKVKMAKETSQQDDRMVVDMDAPVIKEVERPQPEEEKGLVLPKIPPGDLAEIEDDIFLEWGVNELELGGIEDPRELKEAINDIANDLFAKNIDTRARPAEMLRRLALMISNAMIAK